MTDSPQVTIEFDCLPLRSIGKLTIPADASPVFQAKCERLQQAIDKHGLHNTYYLHNASCKFFLTNSEEVGTLEFSFEGTILTDDTDLKSAHTDLLVNLERETCDWLTEPVVQWFRETVARAVMVDFDDYAAAGDLQQTLKRLEKLNSETDEQGGYMGMYL